jgi:hypothetical protein
MISYHVERTHPLAHQEVFARRTRIAASDSMLQMGLGSEKLHSNFLVSDGSHREESRRVR